MPPSEVTKTWLVNKSLCSKYHATQEKTSNRRGNTKSQLLKQHWVSLACEQMSSSSQTCQPLISKLWEDVCGSKRVKGTSHPRVFWQKKKVEHSNANPYFCPTNRAEWNRGMGAILKVSHGYSCHGNHFLLWGFQISEPSFNQSLKKNKGRTQTGTAPFI